MPGHLPSFTLCSFSRSRESRTTDRTEFSDDYLKREGLAEDLTRFVQRVENNPTIIADFQVNFHASNISRASLSSVNGEIMQPVEVLEETRRLLNDGKNWTSGGYFVGEKMCLVGALAIAAGADRKRVTANSIDYTAVSDAECSAYLEARSVLENIVGWHLEQFNDVSGYAMVSWLLDAAIGRCGGTDVAAEKELVLA